MASKTDAELLESTREAIDALTTGGVESYSLNGRSVTKLNLKELWDQVTTLEKRISRTSNGMFGVAEFQDPV